MPGLFDQTKKKHETSGEREPLAARMRPRTLDEFWGQAHILAKGRLLRRAIEADQLSSVIFYGPPGTGKTTLARIIANTTRSKFISINAVLAGVKEIRDSIETAKQNYGLVGRKTILFVDEVHRFNKSQQDALLPWVENGTITLIGATTENPYFEVNKALVSRSRIFQLQSLTQADLRGIALQALRDESRGYGLLNVIMRDEALAHLVNVANGDARALLNALELAVTTTPPNPEGEIDITLDVAEESIQQRAVLYDKEGDAHFDTISAFIKSLRGSDPDAALYWLARMVEAGESPNFILRRMLISACEDVGLADPHALGVVASCAQAFDRVGLPEGRYHLAHATLYLATAPKSNSSMAFFDALATVQKEESYDVPNHLKDASRDKDGLGHGIGYLYPHAYRDHWVAQQYLPDGLQGRVFYHPTTIGYEAAIHDKVEASREAQIAMYEEQGAGIGEQAEGMDRWIGRTFDGGAQRAAAIRDELFKIIAPQNNARVLDIHASSGLLTFEALRRVPMGGVTSVIMPSESAKNFVALNDKREPMERAVILPVKTWDEMMDMDFDCVFDAILGRNFLHQIRDLPRFFRFLEKIAAPDAKWAFANVLLWKTPYICKIMDVSKHLDARLVDAWKHAENEIRGMEWADTLDEETVQVAVRQTGLKNVQIRVRELPGTLTITSAVFDHWFGRHADQPTYLDKLACRLSAESCDAIEKWARTFLRNQTVDWPATVLFVSSC